MANFSMRAFSTAVMVFAVLLIGGCAGMKPGSPQVFDPQRIEQAIGIDDVGYVRSSVESRTIAVNQNMPAMGYEAMPMIALAARNGAINTLKYLISAGANVNVR